MFKVLVNYENVKMPQERRFKEALNQMLAKEVACNPKLPTE